MGSEALFLAAAAVAAALATGAAVWAWLLRRPAPSPLDELGAPAAGAGVAEAAVEAFDSCLIRIDGDGAALVAGHESLAMFAERLGASGADADAVCAALLGLSEAIQRQLGALVETGAPCAFEARGPGGGVAVEGRVAGAMAFLRLSPTADATAGRPTAARLAAFLDARAAPAWVVGADGAPSFANRAWLQAAGAETLAAARAAGLTFDRGADDLAREAMQAGKRLQAVRWATADGRRRAFRFFAQPLDGGLVGMWSDDVTEAEEAADNLRRQAEAQEQTLNQIGEGVAIFSREQRLAFHNAAFAELWGLEPAWLIERPSHGELLDRLRQRRRLPESADYARWKAEELAAYEALAPAEDLWRLPDGRALRLIRQPHLRGGLLLLFSDITDELKLKSEFNALILVQQATLDKLTDAVAVFASDGRLKLHNEAFERFWDVSGAQLAAAADFEGVVELCLHRLHDLQFWRDLKARVTDPQSASRAPASEELKTADQRIVAFQSRPLPDGATLISFVDVTEKRQLEGALHARESALAEAERLKREFVGNVSYELRTPLTTIIGYADLLERGGESLSERARAYMGSVRAAAQQLGRSIDDVLDIAQIDAGEMALDLEDVDVGPLLDAAADRGRRLAEAGGIDLAVAPGADVGLIRGDPRRLGQLLDHLIQNGVRQTPPGGSVTLAAERAQGEVRLSVTDTGRGIPFHVQAHIFDRFVGRDQGGPGLGLALVKALVDLHGGWVALESEPGAGATFTCHLPEGAQAPAAPPELF